jgi:hypothetical protein
MTGRWLSPKRIRHRLSVGDESHCARGGGDASQGNMVTSLITLHYSHLFLCIGFECYSLVLVLPLLGLDAFGCVGRYRGSGIEVVLTIGH